MTNFMQEVVKKVKVPLVIDSTDEKVIEEALKVFARKNNH